MWRGTDSEIWCGIQRDVALFTERCGVAQTTRCGVTQPLSANAGYMARYLSIIVVVQEIEGFVDREVLAEQHFRLMARELLLLKVHTCTVNLSRRSTPLQLTSPKVYTCTVNLSEVSK